MPDTRTHRGAHPEDERLFGEEQRSSLRAGCYDHSWLLTHGYASKSALKLVGDRYSLTQRQRMAVARSACSDHAVDRCRARALTRAEMHDQPLWIDGYNVLISIEAAMAGGVILAARDGCFRDMASLHGSWRRVAETVPAIRLVGQFLEEHRAGRCHWLLDRPVSNSGRLRALLQEQAAVAGWDWHVQLEADPDRTLRSGPGIVVSSDREVLAEAPRWLNLARYVIETRLPESWIVDLSLDQREWL